MTSFRMAWVTGVLILATLLLPSGASANGVAQLVKLTYIPGISNFGPADAEGVLEFSFAERYAHAEVKGLVPEQGYSYEGWMLNSAGDALRVGSFTLDASGIGSMEGSFEGLQRYDYNLFLVAARAPAAPTETIPAAFSIAGSFSIISDPSGAIPGDSRPLDLPETGQAPADGGIGRWQAVSYAMAATGLLIIVVNTLRKREGTFVIKGLYAAFTAMEAAWQYQDVLANNLANANTIGYKREVATTQSFDDVLVSQQAGVPAPFAARIQDIVGQVGTGKFVAEFTTDFSPGSMQSTGQELDLALEEGFFRVAGPDGQAFLTRDGRFGRDANGDLVTSHGYHVLDESGQRIRLPFGIPVSVEPDGAIAAEGEQVARLALVTFAPGQLTRSGEAFFTAVDPGEAISAGVRQGFLETSNTNLAEELTAMVAVQRVYQANQAVLARLDETLEQAAGQLGTLA